MQPVMIADKETVGSATSYYDAKWSPRLRDDRTRHRVDEAARMS